MGSVLSGGVAWLDTNKRTNMGKQKKNRENQMDRQTDRQTDLIPFNQ